MRDDSWTDRNYRAEQLRKDRARNLQRMTMLADATIDLMLFAVDGHEKQEALRWLIAAATKKLEG